jgi:hypothetical protein
VYSKKTIRELFGSQAVARIEARHRGGVSGQKGSRFEDFFAVFRLAQEFARCYASETAKFTNVRRAIIRAQVFAIVDDVAVETRNPPAIEHYQLKNVGQLTWKSVRNDFLHQRRLCRKARIKSRLYLVVPTKKLQSKLESAQKGQSTRCALVVVFPNENVSVLVQTHQGFRNALIKLSPFSKHDVESEKLLTLAKFLCGHWVTAANNKVSIADLARAMQTEAGAFCRPAKGNKKIPSDVARILAAVPGFTWKMRKGFFFWTYGTTDSGRYPHHCWSPEFTQLIERFRKQKPISFDAVEGELR